MKDIIDSILKTAEPGALRDSIEVQLKALVDASLFEAFQIKEQWDKNNLSTIPFEEFRAVILTKNNL